MLRQRVEARRRSLSGRSVAIDSRAPAARGSSCASSSGRRPAALAASARALPGGARGARPQRGSCSDFSAAGALGRRCEGAATLRFVRPARCDRHPPDRNSFTAQLIAMDTSPPGHSVRLRSALAVARTSNGDFAVPPAEVVTEVDGSAPPELAQRRATWAAPKERRPLPGGARRHEPRHVRHGGRGGGRVGEKVQVDLVQKFLLHLGTVPRSSS